jgi:ring-1,2-phenylacetyl-CoA epoxidase subunit PaaD
VDQRLISAEGRRKLEAYGIAPPSAPDANIHCPRCGSDDTELLSEFGSTPCKALRRCRACLEPFDRFKCI